MSLLNEHILHRNRDTPVMDIKGLLTPAQWAEIPVPIFFIKITYATWTPLHYELAVKWAVEHSEGWVFFKDQRMLFGTESDATLFQLWLSEDILNQDVGSVR